MFRPCSRYLSTVLEISFDCARRMFRRRSTNFRYVSNVFEICFDCAQGMFQRASECYKFGYVSTVLEVSVDVLDQLLIYFDRGMYLNQFLIRFGRG